MKHAILRIFATGQEQQDLAKQFELIQADPGFIIVDTTKKDKYPELKNHLFEDITDHYAINLPDPAHKGKTLKLQDISTQRAKAFPKGVHHYLVQFVGSIKKAWLSGVKKAGGDLRDPFGGYTFVVRTDEKKARAIRELPYVRWVGVKVIEYQ